MERIRLTEKLARITDPWRPRIIGELNGQHIKLAKLRGEFVWHYHEHEDELFLALEGRLAIEFRDRTVELEPGDCCIVPRGVEHRPIALPEASVLLFEPAGTLNTGNVRNARTVDDLERL